MRVRPALSGQVSEFERDSAASRPDRIRKIANLIIQPQGWTYVSTGDSACRLTPEESIPWDSGDALFILEIWEHALIKKVPFSALFEQFVEAELGRHAILSIGQTESGRNTAGHSLLGRLAVLDIGGVKVQHYFAGLKLGRVMFMVRAKCADPRLFARYRLDVCRILQSDHLPGENASTPESEGVSRRRLEDVEIVIPNGWDYRVEAFGMASVYNKGLADANDSNEFLTLVISTETTAWSVQHSDPESHFRFQTERMLNPSKILEGADSGWIQSRSASGLYRLIRRARYRFTSSRILHWDHIGLWQGSSAAAVSIRYSDSATYGRFEEDVALIVNTLRFWK